jgi:holo-[acyl-carrier protein] synthase
MKILVGADVQSIDEVSASIDEFGLRYTRKIFTEHEMQCCGANPAAAAQGLAVRFAAKEAVLKILDTTRTVPPWKSIEVRRTPGGRPEIHLQDEAAQLAHDQGIGEISLSLSHGAGIANAVVVAQMDEPERRSPS